MPLFTIMDLCNIAVQIERNGEAAYRQASKRVEDLRAAETLIQLADDELRHAEWFENLQPIQSGSSDYTQLENTGREILQAMIEKQTFSLDADKLAHSQKSVEIFAQSIIFEEDTILFYEMLGSFIDDEKVRAQLNAIIAEERLHVERLKSS